MTRVAAAVLAAGRGERLAGTATPKPLAEFRGRPLVAWALDAARAGGASPVLLVVGHGASAVAAAAPDGVQVVTADDWAAGISASLGTALDALEDEADVTAVCVGLADQPLVGAGAYRRLVAAHRAGASLAVATYGGRRANPVLLARALWPEARALTGDVGARALMGRHEVTEVDCSDTGDPRDVDTVADLQALDADDATPA